jgi:hypothetical protein
MRIVISGAAAAFDSSKNPITDANELRKLDGLVAGDEICSDYLDGELDEIGLTEGTVKVAYDSGENRLRVVTEYRSPRKLKKKELQALADYTQGQWSDGIGEGGFDDYADETGITIDVFPSDSLGEPLSIEQVDDGVKSPRPKRASPLLKAAESGDLDKIQNLLAKGEDINCRNKFNWTPLICAIRCKQTEAALLLIEQGADVSLQARWEGGEQSAIEWAAMQGDLRVLRQLIAAGADVDMREEGGMTPAMIAANRGYIELLQALIDAGCKLNLQDAGGRTALMYADLERPDIAELLLKNGADPKIRNQEGRTAAEEALFQANARAEFRAETARIRAEAARIAAETARIKKQRSE